jgi:acetolactate synthase-1/2/3 large subunit
MINLQELQTIAFLRLPDKSFILNNSGYVSKFQTQKNFFNGDEVGAGPKNGVTLTQFRRISDAFAIPFLQCVNHINLDLSITDTLRVDDPAICEIMVDENQVFAPKLSSRQLSDGSLVSSPLEDMAPFLGRAALADNMLIPTVG